MANIEKESKDFYSLLKYPGPDAIITTIWANRIKEYVTGSNFKFLDAGCGSGRHTAGILLKFPDATGVALDQSAPSLHEAQALLQAKGFLDRVTLINQSFSEPLGLDCEFDIALAIGTIHHSPDPSVSLSNIVEAIKPGGLLACMVYGRRGHQRRYEIKEMLNVMAIDDLDKMKEYYDSYKKKYQSGIDKSIRQLFQGVRKSISRIRYKLAGKESDVGYFRGIDNGIFFHDAFSNPIDVAFDSLELKRMFISCNLELEKMFSLGRIDITLLPPAWRERWHELSIWDKIRISELIDPMPTSFSFIARKLE